jgi:PAS domain S-box-containing protein
LIERAAEDAMRASELRYRTLYQHVPMAILEVDFIRIGTWLNELRATGLTDLGSKFDSEPLEMVRAAAMLRFIDCNDTAMMMLRAKTKSDFRRRRGVLATAQSMLAIRDILVAIWEGRNTLEAQFEMRDFDSQLHEMHLRWWMEMRDGQLDLQQSVMVLVDVTKLKEAEGALAAEKERLAVTLRAMAEGVITTDVEGVVQFMNPAAANFTRSRAEAAIGRPVREIMRFENERTAEKIEVPIARVALGDLVVELPSRTKLVLAGGTDRLVDGCCAPIHSSTGAVIGTVLVFRDVTEHERLEQELIRATRLESVGILAGGIAHDFNNILTVVLGNVALATMDLDASTDAARSLREAEKATLRARDLTQQLLTFAKGGEPVRAAVHLDGVIREITTFTLHGSKIRPEFAIPADIWPADADKGQIGRVVQNLVLNAVQAMPEGGTVSITLANEQVDGLARSALPPGNYVRIAIADTGIGIKAEHLQRIFDPYFTTKQMGSGLGLAAVYSIVNKHHGAIDVESQVGTGTTFRIWLPASQAEVLSSDGLELNPQKISMSGRVLFMDDEEPIRQLATFLLRRFGFEVVCVADGAEVIRKYLEAQKEGNPFVLVMVDLTVPGGIGGREAVARLLEIDPAVKAIVSSGYSSDPVLANYREHGFCGVAAKPYEMADLAKVLRTVMAETKA